jgi:2-oxoisovalerate dehydrogenase E2 component (dihydrolipoyl transacylase)
MTTIAMPQLGESVTEGTVGNWLKQVGDRVEKYEPLVEVTTDKVNSEIPSPVAGVLVEILVAAETTVLVGTGICRIDETNGIAAAQASTVKPDAAPAATPSHDKTTLDGPRDEMELLRSRSSPVVRRIASERGIAIAQVTGSGIGGRVTKRDILAFLEAAPASPDALIAPARPVRAAVQVQPGDVVIPNSPMRRAIAGHMVRSAYTAPHVTTVMEVDMSGLVAHRAARREEFTRREGIDLSYLAYAIKAVTAALREHPRLNAVWDEERTVQRGAIHIGVAVGLDDGLVVPVIRHADRLSLAGLAHSVADLTARARGGTLKPDELTGGTFTVNNPGTFGSISSTPILVQPQVAIISTEAIVKRPVVVNDAIAIRSMMNLSLSFDHRALDGLAAARFLQQVKAWLERVDAEQQVE